MTLSLSFYTDSRWLPSNILIWLRSIASDKERVHNAVETDIFGIFRRVLIDTNLASRKTIQGR